MPTSNLRAGCVLGLVEVSEAESSRRDGARGTKKAGVGWQIITNIQGGSSGVCVITEDDAD